MVQTAASIALGTVLGVFVSQYFYERSNRDLKNEIKGVLAGVGELFGKQLEQIIASKRDGSADWSQR